MVVRIRLAIHGRRGERYFQIVAINGTKARNAKPLEKLGEYIPRPIEAEGGGRVKRVEWSVDRIKYWLGVGAQPSKTVLRLLEQAQIVNTPPPEPLPDSDVPPSTTTTVS